MTMTTETVEDNNSKLNFRKGGQGHPEVRAAPGEGLLAGYIYHDLRHPLTAILAYSELLEEDDLNRLQREDYHREIRQAVSRMNDLISLLLESSRDPTTLPPEVADIPGTLKRAIRVVAVRPEFRRIVIRYNHEGLTEGEFDPRGLQQVVTNIVLNACQAVPPDSGRIQVTSVGREDGIEIRIGDNGPGIPESVRPLVFQPFVSYGKEGGTGLGLAIAQKIMRDHGGEIYLETAGDEGTSFRLVLPFVGRSDHESLTPHYTRESRIAHFSITFSKGLNRSEVLTRLPRPLSQRPAHSRA
jgi:signal transduction histidine kinase